MKPTGYCKEAVLSVAADFNSGALLCECDNEGTEAGQTSVCAKMGGQCSCKPNVIGRQCTKCRPDFFGFPDCKQVRSIINLTPYEFELTLGLGEKLTQNNGMGFEKNMKPCSQQWDTFDA